VKEFLSQRRVPFVEHNVAVDHQAAMEMVQRSGQQGVPVTIIGDEVVVGFDRPRLEQILAKVGTITPIRLGASVADAAHITRQQGSGLTSGAYVGEVKRDSVAARMGLCRGDIIVELAGQTIHTARDVETVMPTVRHGQPTAMSCLRDGQRQELRFVP
jgi:glutaredoxin 3